MPQEIATDNRAELLDRALDLFAAYGYDGVGVQNICEAAGVTKPTLYHYFHSKRGLLETLLKGRIDELLSPLMDLAAAEGDMREILKRAASFVIAFAKNNPSFYRLYLALWFAPTQSDGREVAAAFHGRHFEAMEAICSVAMQGTMGSKGRNRATTASFLGMLNSAIGLALNDYSALNDRVAGDLVDQFLFGVLRQPTALVLRKMKP
jgi:AcrR family transcriptional regulator